MERKGFVCPFCAKYYRDSEEKHQYNGWTMCKNCCDKMKKHEGLILEEDIDRQADMLFPKDTDIEKKTAYRNGARWMMHLWMADIIWSERFKDN